MRFSRDAFIAVFAVAIACLALEAGLRLAQVRFNASLYQPEAERGFALRPHARGWNVPEHEAFVTINSDGLRDVERPVARPPHTLRIAVIGSCEAEARQVPLEQTFEAVMKRELDAVLAPRGINVDVLNFGVPGYTFSQEYLTLRNHALKYDPQIVLFVLQPQNYVRNTRDLFPGDPDRTPFYEIENGRLVPDTITRATPPPDPHRVAAHNRIADIENSSHVIGLGNRARMELRTLLSSWAEQWTSSQTAHAAGGVRDDFEYLRYAPDAPAVQKSWQIADAFVEEMKAECDRRGIEFRIVSVDANPATHPDPAVREAFMKHMGLTTLDATEQRMQRFCNSRNIPLLLLAPPLLAYAESHHAYLRGDPNAADNMGFWNALGHQVVGATIVRDLLHSSPVLHP